MNDLSPSAQRVQSALQALGMSLQVVELPTSTRSAADAAQAVGCTLGQIVKSLVFRTLESDRPVLIETSGSNRVDEQLISSLIGETICKANADYVRQHTGFVIGGVPPIGHTEKLLTFIDQDLVQYTEIWAAAGTPNAVFRLTPAELVQVTGGQVIKVN